GPVMRLRLIAVACLLTATAVADEPKLIGHWPLTSDAKDCSGNNRHGTAEDVEFTGASAAFNGRGSRVDVADAPPLGTRDFSIALWVHTEEQLDDTIGDLISQFDPITRTGFNLSVKHHAGVTGSQANFRHLQFGIDQGQQDAQWRDEGRPGNAIFIHSMAVHEGGLYAGTVEGGTNEDLGHVYRYDGDQWIDLGAPWKSNGVTAMASYNGHLYVGVSRVLLHYSGLEPTTAHHIGGKVFRYESGKWSDLGQLLGLDGVQGMAEFKGKLYVTGFYQPALFRYEGGTEWTSLGAPGGMRPEALCVYNGALYATGYDEGAVYRFDGDNWSRTGVLGDATQVYGLVVHEGKLLAGTWPQGTVYRYEGDDNWVRAGRLGTAEEVMGMNVYNGKLYAGMLPLAEIFRYDNDLKWTSVGRVDTTPDVVYRRAWSMAVYQGRLFSGTLPSGHVKSFEAGKNVTYDHPLRPGWRHVAAVREQSQLILYVDGNRVAESTEFSPASFDLATKTPLRIGFGSHDFLNGRLHDVRLYDGAMSAESIKQLATSR
ncbi:MAG: LamG domain-containing protein, partial [Planctomycetales bacterium]|nr:LamG domain-containing protein [Planctomycetales bacterium]